MNLEKKEKSELLQVYNTWWDSYLNGDIKTYDKYLADDYRFVGSTDSEEFLNKKDATQFFAETADQLSGKVELRNVKRTIEPLDKLVLITDLADAYILSDGKWVFYSKFRFSSLLRKDKEVWKFIYQHFSAPDAKAQEGETLGLEKITKENFELRDAIKRHTVELQQKNRELEIEASLERVRSRTMAMHKSEELSNVAKVLFQQVKELGIPQWTCGFNIWETGDTEFTFYPGGPDGEILPSCKVPLNEHPIFRQFDESRKRGDELFVYEKEGEVQADHYRYMCSLPGVGDMLQGMLDQGLEFPEFQIDHIANFSYGNIVFITYEPFPEMHQVFIRFAKVFEQTYTRFLDLQKAEEQAREAQIEAALEKVRSRTMAMQKGEELKEVVVLLYKELIALGVTNFVNCGYVEINEKINKQFTWVTNPGGDSLGLFYLPLTGDAIFDERYAAWKQQQIIFHQKVAGRVRSKHLEYSITTFNSKEAEEMVLNQFPDPCVFYCFNFSHGYLHLVTGSKLKNEEELLLARFTKVFEQTYARFLDLQKAETQANEAQIEASLERVRSKTMAMHNSKDVALAVITLFDEVLRQGIDKSIRCGIGILEGNEGMETWSVTSNSNGEVDLKMGMLNMTIHPFLIKMKKAWEKGETGFTYKLKGNDVTRYYKALNDDPGYPFNAELDTLPENEFINTFFFSEGILFAFSPNPISKEAAKVLKRFTSVFEQTYTRFLDLQKAEAQAREAQIEASLERVRSKAMAMHNSKDLVITANQLFKEFQYLNIKFIRCGVLWIYESRAAEVYSYSITKENEAVAIYGDMKLTGHELMDGVFKHWQLQKEYVHEMKGDAVKRYYKLLNKQVTIPKIQQHKSHFVYAFYFPEGCLYCFTNEKFSEETLRILRKFNSVMGLTYRRYFELKESEARELEVIKGSSLDRVRAEIASMRTADDLNRITPLVWQELTTLGVPFFRCGVFIMDDENQKVHAYLSTPSGESLAALHLDYTFEMGLVKSAIVFWKKQNIYIEEWNRKQFVASTKLLLEQGQAESATTYLQNENPPPRLVLQLIPFAQGMLYIGSADPLVPEQMDLAAALTKAFAVAYSRYEDFRQLEIAKKKMEDALNELKATQTQLIQSEKMASLGELTAGIAHEIQNPLNFVNNFSELSEEMLEELAEEIPNNSDEIVIEILTDLKQNLNKITNHGKRASNIVKGMLEHSRTSSGVKELTDINALADEFLRLSYHGLRAKDKTFNANFKTDFDTTLPKIEVIPQDLGRVILNLINNAFYACAERSRSTSDRSRSNTSKNYKPTVTVSTKKIGETVEIRVKDNGSGIPKDIKEKIFQPFFTTKPTGEGTGLGLSLAYDIITKGHGGELKVESIVEGEGLPADEAGTEFIIQLKFKNI